MAIASAFNLSRHAPTLDRLAIGLSALCAAHCLTTAIAVVALASFGGVLLNPLIHEVGMAFAIVLGLVALVQGVWRHGYMLPFAVGCFGLGMMAGALSLPHGEVELLATLAGVATLALGHDLNFRASRG
jgi:MerC mercury resistance protein